VLCHQVRGAFHCRCRFGLTWIVAGKRQELADAVGEFLFAGADGRARVCAPEVVVA
jgi:hypothetical protein